MTAPSRFLLVELEEDLSAVLTTRTGAWRCIKQVVGVRSITDLAAISQATLDVILRKPEPKRTRKQNKVPA